MRVVPIASSPCTRQDVSVWYMGSTNDEMDLPVDMITDISSMPPSSWGSSLLVSGVLHRSPDDGSVSLGLSPDSPDLHQHMAAEASLAWPSTKLHPAWLLPGPCLHLEVHHTQQLESFTGLQIIVASCYISLGPWLRHLLLAQHQAASCLAPSWAMWKQHSPHSLHRSGTGCIFTTPLSSPEHCYLSGGGDTVLLGRGLAWSCWTLAQGSEVNHQTDYHRFFLTIWPFGLGSPHLW